MKDIEIKLTVSVAGKDIGPLLICDDPEGYPLAGYGLPVQAALKSKLGWTDKIEKELMNKSGIGNFVSDKVLEELAGKWAEEQMKNKEVK